MDESLVKRLAGPSTGKAGLAKDQSEINKVIAEASKGSKFYHETKRRDDELTERIERMLKKKNQLMLSIDVAKVEASVDHMIAELESKRDLSQIICHVDMDAFYAAVEMLDNPDLIGKPFGVSGGVLSTASYEARQFGVRSGMPAFIGKKLCPQLIIVPTHFPRYIELSGKVMDVLKGFDPDMSRGGLDEAYLNLTKYCDSHDLTGEECVRRLREEVHRETKLTCSAGIAPNCMLAKICSDKNKPNGQFALPFERKAIVEFMRDLPIRKIPGIGRVSERVLESVGVKTCGDVHTHRVVISVMDRQLGLESLLCAYLGIGSNVVEPGVRESRKSVGVETTFYPLDNKEKLLTKLEKVAEDLEEDMQKTGWAGRTVTLKYKLDTYQTYTRAKSVNRWVTSKEDLFTIGKELFLKEWPLKLRLIGLRVTNLKDLRAPAGALEKFFEKGNTGESPAKKRKVSEDDEHHYMNREEEDTITLEDDEDDDEIQEIEAPQSISTNEPSTSNTEPSTSIRPPNSTTAVRSTKSLPVRSRSKPLSKIAELQKCPICAHKFEVDNAGLNAHIDFCLSRTAIMEANSFTGEGVADDFGGFGAVKESESSTLKLTPRKRPDPFGVAGSLRAKRKR